MSARITEMIYQTDESRKKKAFWLAENTNKNA